MDSFDLEVKTESKEGTGQYLRVNTYDIDGENAGKFFVFFDYGGLGENDGRLYYSIESCLSESFNIFEPELSKEEDPGRIWRFSVSKAEGDVRFAIYDNENEALNILLSETCDDGEWEGVWKRQIKYIEFPERFSAAEVYRFRAKESETEEENEENKGDGEKGCEETHSCLSSTSAVSVGTELILGAFLAGNAFA